jgi:hypothetical protein
LDFHTTRTTLVAHVVLSIPEKKSQRAKDADDYGDARSDFIDRVVIGPTSDKDLSLQAVRAFFVKRGLDVEVQSSKIPFRDW